MVLTLREIHCNTRFIKSTLSELHVEKPKVAFTDNVFKVLPVKNTTSGSMEKFAAAYPDLEDFSELLRGDLIVIVFSIIVVFAVTVSFVTLAETKEERREFRSSVSVTMICFLFIVQMLSCWQITTYNYHISHIESYHHIDTGLLVDLYSFIPDNSLIISLTFSALYNLFNVVFG